MTHTSRAEIEAKPNVVGTCLGPKRVDGTDTDHQSLIALVTKKVPLEELDPDDVIDDAVVIQGRRTETDVQAVGIPHLLHLDDDPEAPEARDAQQTDDDAGFDPRARHRPAPGGASVGNNAMGAGTLGYGMLEHDGDLVGLTNAHVAAPYPDLYQPAPMDGNESDTPISHLKEASEPDPDTANTTDSALVYVDEADVSPEVGALGELVGFRRGRAGEEYAKSGRTTGVTRAELIGTDGRVYVAFGEETVLFEGLDVFDHMSAPGDSGSLICSEGEDGVYASSLLFAGSSEITLGVPMDAVEAHHGELSLYDPGDEDEEDEDEDEEDEEVPEEPEEPEEPTEPEEPEEGDDVPDEPDEPDEDDDGGEVDELKAFIRRVIAILESLLRRL